MILDLDAEHHEFRQSVRGSLARLMIDHVPHTELVDEIESITPSWDAIGRTGWLDLAGDAAPIDLFALHLELGRSLAIGPYTEAAAAATLLAGADKSLRANVFAGRAVVVPLVVGGDLTVADDADGAARLDGARALVDYAAAATHLLVVVPRVGGSADLHALATTADGLDIVEHVNTANLPLARVAARGVALGAAIATAAPNEVGLADRLRSLLQVAQVVGMGERLLELCTTYAKERRQFDRPIGEFQAVQYLCTDIALHVHQTYLLAVAAARGHATIDPVRLGFAVTSAAEGARRIALCAHEVFAGAAFMMESDVQRYSRRLKHVELALRARDVSSDVLDAVGVE